MLLRTSWIFFWPKIWQCRKSSTHVWKYVTCTCNVTVRWGISMGVHMHFTCRHRVGDLVWKGKLIKRNWVCTWIWEFSPVKMHMSAMQRYVRHCFILPSSAEQLQCGWMHSEAEECQLLTCITWIYLVHRHNWTVHGWRLALAYEGISQAYRVSWVGCWWMEVFFHPKCPANHSPCDCYLTIKLKYSFNGKWFANRRNINTVQCAVVQISISSNMTVFTAIPRLVANHRQAMGLLCRL